MTFTIFKAFNKSEITNPKSQIAIVCRNIKQLHNFEPPATDEEIRAAARQFVRKLSGFQKPSAINLEAFETAIDEIAKTSAQLLAALKTNAPPKNRETEHEKAHRRNQKRFGPKSDIA